MTTAGANHTTGAPELASAPPRRLYRSRLSRTFAGVCGGIAEYYGSDPTAVRLLAVILAVLTGIFPLLVLYLVAAIVIPERVGDDLAAAGSTYARVETRATPGHGALIVGILLVSVGAVSLANQLFRVDWALLWPMALVVCGAAIVLVALRRTP